MVVAWETRKAKIFDFCQAAMLLGNDVINFVNNIRKLLGHQAVFTTRISTLPNLTAKMAVHRLLIRMSLE